MPNVEGQIEKIASHNEDLEVDDLKERFEQIKETEISAETEEREEELALRKLASQAKRQARALQALEEYQGYIVAANEPADISSSPTVDARELFVRNALFVSSDEKPYLLTLWGKVATNLHLPVRREVKFKARTNDPSVYDNLSIPESAMSTVEVVDDVERQLSDFIEPLEKISNSLDKVEEWFGEVSGYNTPVILTKGGITSVYQSSDRQGRYSVQIDDFTKGFDEDNETRIKVPESMVNRLEQDKELVVVGDMWRPNQTRDSEGNLTDEPGDVTINVWDLEVFGFGELL